VDWLTTRSRILRPSRTRAVFLLIAVGAFAVTEFGRQVYRPWAYRRALADFGLADSVGNLGGIIVQVFLTLAVVNATREQSLRWAAFLSCGYIAYEFAQPYLPKGTFDWQDVAATLVGGGLSCVILWAVWRTHGSPPGTRA
jgi:TRAP-type uncharacterized transport system fused permease subunit